MKLFTRDGRRHWAFGPTDDIDALGGVETPAPAPHEPATARERELERQLHEAHQLIQHLRAQQGEEAG